MDISIDKTATMIPHRVARRIQKYRERLFSHNYDFSGFDPPLRLTLSLVSRWGPGDKFENIRKKSLSMNLVTIGEGVYEQNGHRGTVKPGQVFLAHRGANQVFKTGRTGYLHKRSILVEGRALEAILRATGLIDHDVVTPLAPGRVIALYRQSYRLLRMKPADFLVRQSALAYEIILELARSMLPEYPVEIRAAVDYMAGNISRPVTVEDIARSTGVSVRHCTRLFQKHFRLSPVRFFTNQKMTIAEQMLTNTSMPVKQVAAAVGYEDPYHFSLNFKKHFGRSPKHFRETRGR